MCHTASGGHTARAMQSNSTSNGWIVRIGGSLPKEVSHTVHVRSTCRPYMRKHKTQLQVGTTSHIALLLQHSCYYGDGVVLRSEPLHLPATEL